MLLDFRQSFELWNELGSFGENFNKKIDKHSRLGCKAPTCSTLDAAPGRPRTRAESHSHPKLATDNIASFYQRLPNNLKTPQCRARPAKWAATEGVLTKRAVASGR